MAGRSVDNGDDGGVASSRSHTHQGTGISDEACRDYPLPLVRPSAPSPVRPVFAFTAASVSHDRPHQRRRDGRRVAAGGGPHDGHAGVWAPRCHGQEACQYREHQDGVQADAVQT